MGKLAKLACSAVEWVYDDRAADHGLQLSNLCREAGVNANHIYNDFGTGWQQASELVIRLLISWQDGEVRWERLAGIPTPANSTHNGLGTDKLKGKPSSLRLLTNAVGNPNRCLVASSIVYTRGTRDDHSCAERSDEARIRAFQDECGLSIAGTMAEHLECELGQSASVRQRIQQAMDEDRLPTASVNALSRSFSELVIVDALPEGPSRVSGTWYGSVGYPGDDEPALQTLLAHGKYGVARCSPNTWARAEDETPREHWEPLEVIPGDFANEHAVPLNVGGMQFRLLAERELLVRERVSDATVSGNCWRLFGLADDPALAATLLALAEEQWIRDCIERARRKSSWGRMSISNIWCHSAMRSVLHLADAALVSAERLRKADEYRRRELR